MLAVALAVPLSSMARPSVLGQSPSVTVTSPLPGSVVEGKVMFQGTAEDADGDLTFVVISISGEKNDIIVNLPPGETTTAWEKEWKANKKPDGLKEVSVVVMDQGGAASQPVNFTIVLDNAKEPWTKAVKVLFDEAGDGTFAKWLDLDAVPTTRVRFELEFSEEMDSEAVAGSLTLAGGDSSWQLAPQGLGQAYWLEVSYLQVSTNYTLAVTTSATDRAGNPLREPYGLNFTTAAEQTPGTPPQGFLTTIPFDMVWIWVIGAAVGGGVGTAVLWKRGLLGRMWNSDRVRHLRERVRNISTRFRKAED